MDIQAATLNRTMACNGSIALGADNPRDPLSETEDKREGVAAHYVAAQVLSGNISDPIEMVDREMPNGIYVNVDMADFVSEFTTYIQDRSATFGDFSRHGVEAQCDFEITDIVRVVGRVDYWAFDASEGVLYIDVLKYGWRIVEPQDDWSLIAYAIGVCLNFKIQAKTIVMTYHQPRPMHRDGTVRGWVIDADALVEKHVDLVTTLTSLANELRTGENCRNCGALAICRPARIAGLNGVDAIADHVFSDEISNDALSFELDTLTRAENAIKYRKQALNELATHRINEGQAVDNYTIDQSFGNLKWNEGVTAETVLALTGIKVAKDAMITPTQSIKLGIPETVIPLLASRAKTGFKLSRVSADKLARKLFGGK